MSSKYPGGLISKTAPTPSGPYANDTAPGVWTLEQQAYWTKLGQWPTAGNVNPNAFIENLFSTYLYTGNSSTQTITNGIDLSGNGGLVWTKNRTTGGTDNLLWDTVRGASYALLSNDTNDSSLRFGAGNGVSAFGATGFTVNGNYVDFNASSNNYASWTFRKQPKFFTQGTFTGDGTTNKVITHDLGGTTGFIIVKRTDSTGNWQCWHRTFTAKQTIFLNTTDAKQTYSGADDITVTDNSFTVGTNQIFGNGSGFTYVYYVFAHDAGGFGLTGTDNVISCGSFTTDGSGAATVTLGYEPQWILCKPTSSTGDWFIADNMRGFSLTSTATLYPNRSNAENALITFNSSYPFNPTATGFTTPNALLPSRTYIYIAIRRGPMAVPTVGTSVYNGIARTGNGTATTVSNSGFTPDMVMSAPRTAGPSYGLAFPFDRLRGALKLLETRSAQAEQTGTGTLTGFDVMNGYIVGVDASGYGAINANAVTYINWNFKRAPGFFDEVCYTGDSSDPKTVSHNLGVAPELMIFKARDVAAGWRVWGGNMAITSYLALSETSAVVTGSTFFGSTLPTSTSFYVGSGLNTSGRTIVAYLFATCAGVSKVGSYTGTGAAQTINCGFTGGARFVMIKRTDSTGDWYVWDSARGIIPSNDPYLLLNSTAAEVTGTDYVDTTSVGFDITSTAPAAINANGGTFIFLAIA